MIRAHIQPDLYGFSLCISLVDHPPEGSFDMRPRIWRLGSADSTVSATWEEIPPDGLIGQPTFRLSDEHARALLETLTRHYQGAEDTRALRRDYDAERGRVDGLIGHLAAVTRTLAAPPEPPEPRPLRPRPLAPVRDIG